MNEVEKKVLYIFVDLLEKYPGGDIPFLWVQAGGKIAVLDEDNPNNSRMSEFLICGSLRFM